MSDAGELSSSVIGRFGRERWPGIPDPVIGWVPGFEGACTDGNLEFIQWHVREVRHALEIEMRPDLVPNSRTVGARLADSVDTLFISDRAEPGRGLWIGQCSGELLAKRASTLVLRLQRDQRFRRFSTLPDLAYLIALNTWLGALGMAKCL